MLNTPCPTCGAPKNPNARQCKRCSNDTIRRKLKGVKHDEDRRRNISEARRRQQQAGHQNFDLAAYMRDKPHPFAAPAGTERIVKDGRVQVRCADGKWRYRSRLVWEKVNGPIPPGRIIHHGDEDPMNDDPSNLECLTRKQHLAVHAALRAGRA